MSDYFKLSQYAIQKLNSCGYEAYVVGGFVRNMIMDLPPSDIDICTNARPEETAAVFCDFKVIQTGVKHGTVTVIIENTPLEITTFRIDGEYKNHRKPRDVAFTSSIFEDLSRRDFTMNAMAYSEKSGVIDPFGGRGDIKQRLIRCVGDSEKRFSEDALRILRALRFSSVLKFDIEESTKKAIFSCYRLLSHISAERITDEFLKLLTGENVADVFWEFGEVFEFLTGSNTKIFAKELEAEHGDPFVRLSFFDNTDFLRLSAKEERLVKFIKENKDKSYADKCDILKLLNKGDTYFAEKVLSTSKNKYALPLLYEVLEKGECYRYDMLSVSGDDIKNLGFKGKDIGTALDNILNLVMSGKLKNNKAEILSFITKKL